MYENQLKIRITTELRPLVIGERTECSLKRANPFMHGINSYHWLSENLYQVIFGLKSTVIYS